VIEYQYPDGPVDCHPLVREHFAEEHPTSNPETFREAHGLLCEHYSKQAPYQPETLERMTPLFYAVYHGCQAGKHQEVCGSVYRDRILGGQEFFLWRKLGAYGVDLSLLSNFFANLWDEPVPTLSIGDQAWVTNCAGFALRALGRLTEALRPMKLGSEADVRREDWDEASISLGSLGEVNLTLGNIREAVAAAERAVKAANRRGNGFLRLVHRAKLADALHQSGDLAASGRLFHEAEKIQAEFQPTHPLLYSVAGYQYCDLLLTKGEAPEVLRRATQTLKSAEDGRMSMITIALDQLSLGRAHPHGSPEAANRLNQAVSGLRRAGTLHYLPLGLLARAANFRHTRDFDKAQHDLDEVRILANRCGMRLHLTDYHLEQARLLLAQQQPDDARPHYESAKKLVEETGYHRRDPELGELRTQLVLSD
jgi:tetratricopeptide (TPR) repeat protein